MVRRSKASGKDPTIPFARKLVLNQWLLSLFGVGSFEELVRHLRDEGLEGLDENNIHRLHQAIITHHAEHPLLQRELLLEYDQNIVEHTQRLNEGRIRKGEGPIVWKYFQYLALVFTEIYLARYFADPEGLLRELNQQIEAYNADKGEPDRIVPFDEAAEAWVQLNKVAFWMATGSGKTLLMHANLLQFQQALRRHGRGEDLDRILLLTPNEGLSLQHVREFRASGIEAELFDKDRRGLFQGRTVEVVEVTRLREEMGDRTIAIDAFEGRNLVLVDEGHRGASGGDEGAWMRYRNALCEEGFSFEYSATFEQAVKGSARLTDLYAKTTLWDYSYRHFYADGFGKDYQILNLEEGTQESHLELYLVACLLSFFQQQRLQREQESAVRSFNIERPLWVFVGGRVTATLGKKEASDIVVILEFLRRYVGERRDSVERIDRVLNQGLVTATGENLFAGRFSYLNSCSLSAEQIFDETLEVVFNAPGGGKLYVENLRGVTGEVALRIGADNEAFGVVNVGDDGKLVKLCDRRGIATGAREFAGSLFQEINRGDSRVNLLIGSKKFTEGWNSWRVATMGLMNVGKGEGAQVLQLFGRGVRLKGYDLSLKRSSKVALPATVQRPKHIGLLETLGVFGIHADYMAQFRDFLTDAGLPENDGRIEFLLPVFKELGGQKLKTVGIRKVINGVSTVSGDAFRQLGPVPTLAPPEGTSDESAEYLQRNQIVLNWYPKIQAFRSSELAGGKQDPRNETHLALCHLAFLDFDRIWFALERFKAERGWHNLNVTREGVEALLCDQSWYRLQIPEEELIGNSYQRVKVWEEIAVALLKKYTERYYTFRKREWELPHLEYRCLESDDPNFLGVKDSSDAGYRISIDGSQAELASKLEELTVSIKERRAKSWGFGGLRAVWFGRHLYQPLLYLDGKLAEISPAPLNKGERQFVEDLREFCEKEVEFFEGRELYVLRNLSRGRGIGFFEAGNFHPDFILWLVAGRQQHVVFVDPKGLRHVGVSDPKIRFYKTIKEIEKRLGDRDVHLESFIVSNTRSSTMRQQWGVEKSEMGEWNILFQEEDKVSYIGAMLKKVVD